MAVSVAEQQHCLVRHREGKGAKAGGGGEGGAKSARESVTY